MKILYYHTAVPARIKKTDAVVQEIDILRSRFKGQMVNLRPRIRAIIPFPRFFFGLQWIIKIRKDAFRADCHHVFNPDLFLFPILRWLGAPIVYSVVAGVGDRFVLLNPAINQFVAWITVNNPRDWLILSNAGYPRIRMILPGFDHSRIFPSPHPSLKKFTILVGSAPWTLAQFRSKGVGVLLEAARRMPDLNLVFLWRGYFFKELQKRIKRAQVGDRVRVFNDQVDINRVLSGVHAGIVLADRSTLVKAYPNSLLECLAAGRPILVSRSIALSDLVEETKCGLVLEGLNAEEVIAKITELRDTYEEYSPRTRRMLADHFAPEAMIRGYENIYESTGRL
jgi:glycosyltransferase involved in cell wall biosynthesis